MTVALRAVSNMGYETYLTQDYHAGTDTKIYVYDGSQLPSAPSSICIMSMSNTDSVIVTYSAKTGNELTVGSITHYNRPGAESLTYQKGSSVTKEFSDTVSGGGGGGGTTDYTLLNNKPQIGGIELVGNKTLADLKILSDTFTTAEKDKVLTIGADGKVFANTGINTTWANITGDITTNINLQNALNGKVNTNVTGGSTPIKGIGLDASGNLVYET